MSGSSRLETHELALRVREALEAVGEEIEDSADSFNARIAEIAVDFRGGTPDVHAVASRWLARKVKDARFELKERVLELESLYDLGLAVAGTLDLDRLADEILFRSISLTNSRSGALVLIELGSPILSRSFGAELLTAETAASIEIGIDGVINNEASSQPTCGQRIHGCEKCLLVPIHSEGRRLGILAVGDKETRDTSVADYVPSDARLLKLFASQAATAIETARLHRAALEKERLDRELEVAAGIQREILPKEVPVLEGVRLAAEYRPTRQVGGDYFDFFPLAHGDVAFVVADVSGKGVPAALLVSTLASAIHLQIEESKTPDELIGRVHRHLFRFSRQRKFSTVFLARLRTKTGLLEYVSAGHNPALLLRAATGKFELLPATGQPVGMFWDSSWSTTLVELHPGDRLCVYTDGITEAQNAGEEDYGVDRLMRHMGETLELPVEDVAKSLLRSVADFAGEAPQYDDQTVVLLSR